MPTTAAGRRRSGRGCIPRVPDMRTADTQSLSDGELFFIIEHGVQLTGMPAWGNDSPESATAGWQLVHFIRHLPKLTPEEIEEMESLNPKSPAEIREQIKEEEFLKGGGEPSEKPVAGTDMFCRRPRLRPTVSMYSILTVDTDAGAIRSVRRGSVLSPAADRGLPHPRRARRSRSARLLDHAGRVGANRRQSPPQRRHACTAPFAACSSRA